MLPELRFALERTPTACDLRRDDHRQEDGGRFVVEVEQLVFSECGGLLLTPSARDFHFALQDLVQATSRAWDRGVPSDPESPTAMTTPRSARRWHDGIPTQLACWTTCRKVGAKTGGKRQAIWTTVATGNQSRRCRLQWARRRITLRVAAASRQHAPDEPRHRPGEPAARNQKVSSHAHRVVSPHSKGYWQRDSQKPLDKSISFCNLGNIEREGGLWVCWRSILRLF